MDISLYKTLKIMNNLENFSPAEKQQIPELTHEEWVKHCNRSVDNPELIQWMEQKGINFDSGDIEVLIDGKKEMIATDKNNFGTYLSAETIESKYGKEKRDEIYRETNDTIESGYDKTI